MTHDLARIVREVRDHGHAPWELANEEGYTGLDGPNGLRAALKNERLEIRHTPNYPGAFPGFQGGRWYIWPCSKEHSQKWGLSDDINDYLPPGLAQWDDHVSGYILPDGRVLKISCNGAAPLFYSEIDKYIVDLGGRAAIGDLEECWFHSGRGDVDRVTGVILERYVDRRVFAAIRTRLTMSDGEYELAIGEGIPKNSPLLETKAARKARRKLEAL